MNKIAFLFPGQGAQNIGMGFDLYQNFPQARAIFEEADKALGFGLSKLCFEGPFEELTRTQNCQPAILTASIASLVVLKTVRPDLQPSYTAGLSLGEYAALVASGIIPFKDAVCLVRRRGELMEAAAAKNPGKMLCVLGLDKEKIDKVCASCGCEIANMNAPGQIIVSCRTQDAETVSAKAMEAGAKRVIALDVSGAFHCSLMTDAAVGLQPEIEKISFQKAGVPLVSNVDAREQTDPTVIKKNLVHQVNSPTFWEASMRYLLQAGVMEFYEIGPGSVLKGLMKKIDSQARVVNAGSWADIQALSGKQTDSKKQTGGL